MPLGTGRDFERESEAWGNSSGNAKILADVNTEKTLTEFLLEMLKYCSVAVCTNGTHNRPDLSYFGFPSNVKIGRKWETFCRRADNKFKNLSDPRICSLHFKYEDLKKGLSGKLSIITGAVPTIFDPNKRASKETLRTERLEKRTLRVQQSAAFQTDERPAKKKPKICDKDITDVPASEALTKSVGCKSLPYCDHDYTDRIDKVDESHRNVVYQTDLTIEDFEAVSCQLQKNVT